MIVDRGRGREVIIRLRDENGARIEKRISSVYPYCFVEDENAALITNALRREAGHTGLYGESLTKVTFGDPSDVGKLKKDHPDIATWEGNIPFVNRVLVDTDFIPPNYEHRIWFLDGEWKVQSGEITILTVLDSFTGNRYTWFTHPDYAPGKYDTIPCKAHPEGLDEVVFAVPAICFPNERALLSSFARHMAKHDPDIITGWNVMNADLQQIFRRMTVCGINPGCLSPFNRVRYEYGDWSQPIPGRLCIDLMHAFTRLWILKNGQLPSRSLADVSGECLEESKLPLANGHDTYYTDIGTYLDYNIRDVLLLPKLNGLNNAIEHHLAIQSVVGCDLRSTPFVTKLFTVLALRDKDFDRRIPSRPQFEKVEYEGADVQEPEAGVYDMVGVYDVKAMYHANVVRHHISWENISEDGVDCGNGTCFTTDEVGLLGRQMNLLTVLRDRYKHLLREAESPEERSRYDALQYATKSLVASLYGVTGDAKYPMYHPEIAAAVTFTSRQTLRWLREECLKRGYPVIYGHTDSVFVQVPSVEEGEVLNDWLNSEMAPIEIEFERWCDRLLITAKNRYAGSVVWTEGVHHEPSVYFKGIELKQTRLPNAMKTTMRDVIGGILAGEEENAVTERLASLVASVVAGEVPIEDLLIKGELKRDLADYKSIGEVRAAAAWANDTLGKGYRKGSFFKATLDENGNYIGFDEPSDIEGFAKVGYSHLAQRFIVSKVEPYYGIVGWDFQPVLNALHGKVGVEWI